jgi:hypothetical protein
MQDFVRGKCFRKPGKAQMCAFLAHYTRNLLLTPCFLQTTGRRSDRSRSTTPVGASEEEVRLAKHTVVELKAKCSEAGIDIKGLKTKTEYINALCEIHFGLHLSGVQMQSKCLCSDSDFLVCMYAGKGAQTPEVAATAHDASGVVTSVRRNLRDDPVMEEGEDELVENSSSKIEEPQPESPKKRSKPSTVAESPSRLALLCLEYMA